MLNGGEQVEKNSGWARRQSRRSGEHKTHIYFLESDGRIKIGISRNVRERLKEIEKHMSVPPTLLGVVVGTYQQERAIHKKLAPYHLKSEWFKGEPPVRELTTLIINQGISAARLRVSKPIKTELVPHPPDPMAMPKILRMMWPDDALVELQALSGESEETVRGWMDLTIPVPRVVRLALGSVVMRWIFGDGHAPSFREGQPGYVE